ncbi:MAG: FAD-linked oxidase C-terminal domain-containing protein [Pseudomonadota bacterium]
MAQLTDLPRNETGISTAIDILAQRFGPRLDRSGALRQQHAHTTTYLRNQPPDAVVFVEDTSEVQDVVRICGAHHVPIVAFGTGSSLEGHVNAPAGGISVDFSRMDKVLAVHAQDMDVVVQPGVTRKALNAHLRDTGLFFPVDPGADASLGGMVATRASGTNAVRYGTIRENVLGLKAVLPSGEILNTGGRARKSAAGYDLGRLMIGSEGTLGLITELTLKLHGIPEATSAAVCSFDDEETACNAVIMGIQYGLPVARIELLDAMSVSAVNAYSKTDLPEAPLLLLEFVGTEASVTEQADVFSEIAAEFGGKMVGRATKEEDRSKLWSARHNAYFAVCALRPGADALSTDVCVPVSRLAEAVVCARDKASELGLLAPVAGHVGDGNFHMLPLFDAKNPEDVKAVEALTAYLSEMAIAMDGTCTGEHGIGQGKAQYLAAELGTPALDTMAAIKAAIDPKNIMNPGKIGLPS